MGILNTVNEFLRSLGIEWQIALAQAMGIVLLVFIVRKYMFSPLGAIMQQRQEQIANQLANAEAHQLRAESLRKEYEERLSTIADEARQRFEVAAKDAEAARQRTLAQTQAEVRDLYQRHEAQLEVDREQVRRELRGELSDIAVMTATKALRGQLTPAMQSAVIDQVIQELGQQQV